MTVFHWVRHGPTHQKSFCGWRDVPADLSDHAHIARLNAALPPGALVVASDLIRASATADTLSATRTRLPDDPALREFNFGDWEGLGFAEVSARDPDMSRAFWEGVGDATPPGGESWNMLSARVSACIAALSASHPHAHIIAVAHFGVIQTQVRRAANLSARETLAHDIANLSITELRHENGKWHRVRINHLP